MTTMMTATNHSWANFPLILILRRNAIQGGEIEIDFNLLWSILVEAFCNSSYHPWGVWCRCLSRILNRHRNHPQPNNCYTLSQTRVWCELRIQSERAGNPGFERRLWFPTIGIGFHNSDDVQWSVMFDAFVWRNFSRLGKLLGNFGWLHERGTVFDKMS